jgi:hypothetical protein
MKKLYDKENLITLAMMWQFEQGDAMIPNTAHLGSFFPSQESGQADRIGLHTSDSFPSVNYVSKALLPFLVGLSLGKDSVYLSKVIKHHSLHPNDLTNIAYSLGTHEKVEIDGGTVPIGQDEIYVGFVKALIADPSLKHLLDAAIAAPYDQHMRAAVLFVEDPAAWHVRRFEAHKESDFIEACVRLTKMCKEGCDVSDPLNWPNGKLEHLLERSGAYLERNLGHSNPEKVSDDRGSSVWFSLLCEAPQSLEGQDKVDYYRSIFTAYDGGDPRFLRGLRSMRAETWADGHLLYHMSAMLEAAQDKPAIQDVLLTELMLTRSFSKPAEFDFDQVKIDAYQKLVLDRIDPRFLEKLSGDREHFLAKVCQQLLQIPVEEFGQSDLTAVQSTLAMQLPEQELSGIDVEQVIGHLMAAFNAQQLNYQDFRPFRSAQVDLLKYFSGRHELSQDWIDTFEDKDREMMAMAGIGDKRKLSLQALGRVFGSELGI